MLCRFLRLPWTHVPYVAVAAGLSLAALASRAMLAEDNPAEVESVTAAAPAERLREGTRFNAELGYFKPTGDRLTFYEQEGERRLLCLENLNLERIARTVRDSPDTLTWSVSGAVTEYQGANYLLVTQATQLARPARAAGAAALDNARTP